jgi:RimJ/RimL family protein N-acetyltransferase
MRREPVFETERLYVVLSDETDAGFFYLLWTNPRVMVNVGFPHGLKVTLSEIADQLQDQGSRILDSRLLVFLKSTGQAIGECKLGAPDEKGISTTDVKLLPQFWGNKYGVEIKKALVDYLFHRTACQIVEATPNVKNVASIKMQEAVGGVRVGEGVFDVPESRCDYQQPVHHYVYHVYRDL